MNNNVRLNRLKKLATILKSVPEKKFYLGEWFAEDFFEKPVDVKIPDNFIRVECTTAACALGWAALDKGFRRAGLGLRVYKSDDSNYYGLITYKGEENGDAGAKFFGITIGEAMDLFAPRTYEFLHVRNIKPKHVIKRINRLIKKYS